MRNAITNLTIRGTFGKVWLNGQPVYEVKSVEAKVTAEIEDININGEFGQQGRYMGYSIAGTMTLHKINSRAAALYHQGIITGQLPDLTLDIALTDPDSYGAQRVRLYEVQFEELTLAQFETKTVLEETIPFRAGGYDFLEFIEVMKETPVTPLVASEATQSGTSALSGGTGVLTETETISGGGTT